MKILPKLIKSTITRQISKNRKRKRFKKSIRKRAFKHPVRSSKILYHVSRIKFRNKFLK